MSNVTRAEAFARCSDLVAAGKRDPETLVRLFLRHFDGRVPKPRDVLRLAAQWRARAHQRPQPPESTPNAVRCVDCHRCLSRIGGRCAAIGLTGKGSSASRRCAAYVWLGDTLAEAEPEPKTPYQSPIADARAALAARGLLQLVAQFGALGDGRLGLQISARATDAQVVAIYAAVGLGLAPTRRLAP